MATSSARPYWLEPGAERCEVCTLSYVLEMECRCVACDAGICVQCAVTLWETREIFCDACLTEVGI